MNCITVDFSKLPKRRRTNYNFDNLLQRMRDMDLTLSPEKLIKVARQCEALLKEKYPSLWHPMNSRVRMEGGTYHMLGAVLAHPSCPQHVFVLYAHYHPAGASRNPVLDLWILEGSILSEETWGHWCHQCFDDLANAYRDRGKEQSATFWYRRWWQSFRDYFKIRNSLPFSRGWHNRMRTYNRIQGSFEA